MSSRSPKNSIISNPASQTEETFDFLRRKDDVMRQNFYYEFMNVFNFGLFFDYGLFYCSFAQFFFDQFDWIYLLLIDPYWYPYFTEGYDNMIKEREER